MNWLFCGKLKFCFTKILFYFNSFSFTKFYIVISITTPALNIKADLFLQVLQC